MHKHVLLSLHEYEVWTQAMRPPAETYPSWYEAWYEATSSIITLPWVGWESITRSPLLPPPTPQNFIRLPQQFTYAHSYSWVERGTVRVQCFDKEHNTLTLPGLGPWPLHPESSTLYVTRVEQRETSELTCCDAYRSKVQFLKVSWSEFFSCFMPKKHFSSKSICYSTHSYSLQYINFSSQTYILRGNNIRIHTINVSVWVMTKNMLKIGS